MRQALIAIVAGSALAASASADVITMGPGYKPGVNYRADGNATWVMDISDITSYGEYGDPNNVVLTIDINTELGLPAGSQVILHGATWDVTLEAYDPSYLSEITVAFATAGNPELYFSPGVDDNEPGIGTYTGTIDFTDAGFSDIVLPAGIGEFNFFEDYDDSSVTPDGRWVSGTVTWDLTVVPAPGTFALFGLGMFVARRR